MNELKVYLNKNKTRYAVVRVFNTLGDMRAAYHEFRPDDKLWRHVLGSCCPYEWYNIDKKFTHKEIATVFLCVKHCGAGVVSHELLHACL